MNRRIIKLLCIFCCFIVVMSCVACKDNSNNENEEEVVLWENDGTVTFADIPGVRFTSDVTSGETLKSGSTVDFQIKVSSFYEGTPVVLANGEKVNSENGAYTATVSGDTVIEVKGLKLKANSIEGTGTSLDDPYILTSPIDLLYVAEQVNAGNLDYLGAYYQLDADLDFSGEEIEVIGNGQTDNSYFEGYFNGQGHTISNFEINTYNTSFVGLFGILQVNLSNSQGGTVYGLNLKDYTIRATSTDNSIFCGSIAAYGVGANLILCNAENGKIEIYADQNQFAYVGGLFGFQQGFDNGTLTYLSSVAYCTSNVDIDGCEGAIYAAGGISGYISASTGNVPASINNSYSTGNVQGAMLSGGIVGYLAEDTSVINCYSTGTISSQTSSLDSENAEQFCHSYAGGIAGLACPDSIVAESFATGKIYSKAPLGENYQHSGGVIGYASEVSKGSYASNKATVFKCYYAENGTDDKIQLKSGDFLEKNLNWNDCDWVYADNEYPAINTDEHSEYTFDITIKIPSGEEMKVTEFDAYMPMSFWYLEDILPSSITGKDGDTHTSYGYFFDEAHKFPIPDSYVPTHNLTVYVATADYGKVAGKYVLLTGNPQKTAYLTLQTDGNYSYTDGTAQRVSQYKYDGNKIIFKNARFTRYSQNIDGLDSYSFSQFQATVKDGRLQITGGVLYEEDEQQIDLLSSTKIAFDESSPLIAVPEAEVITGTYRNNKTIYSFSVDGTGSCSENASIADFTYKRTGNTFTLTLNSGNLSGTVNNDTITLNGNVLKPCDDYAGTWCVDSKVNKVFTFDGAGNWYYEYFGYDNVNSSAKKVVYDNKSGTYTLNSDSITLSGDMTATATFKSGALQIKTDNTVYNCHLSGSYTGTWVYPEYNLTLTLNGIKQGGNGTGRLEYVYPDETVEIFDIDYSFDNLRDNIICLYHDEEVFGYMNYVPETDTLNSTIYVGTRASFMQNVPLYRFDDLKGEWISDNTATSNLKFNGLGSYDVKDIKGIVEIDGKEIPYSLDDATLNGTFLIDNKVYNISYDESNEILTLISGNQAIRCQRKDSFGSLTLRDGDKNIYTFDGRGALKSQGTMTVTDTSGKSKTYKYAVNTTGLSIYKDGKQAGTLVADSKAYTLNLDKKSTLKVKSEFTGTWAMSGSLENLVIGDIEPNGKLNGRINATDTVFTLEDDHLKFEFNGLTFYIIRVGEKNMVISQSITWYQTNDRIYCAPIDTMFGSWTNSLGASYEFDGMSNSTITNGTARSGLAENEISYYYKLDDNGWFVLWTEIDGETQIYRVDMCDIETKRAFIKDDKAFTLTEGDKLYSTTFIDEKTNTEYSFDGFGKVTANDKTYDYTVENLDQYVGIATVTIVIDGNTKTAKLDFSVADKFTFAFTNEE